MILTPVWVGLMKTKSKTQGKRKMGKKGDAAGWKSYLKQTGGRESILVDTKGKEAVLLNIRGGTE